MGIVAQNPASPKWRRTAANAKSLEAVELSVRKGTWRDLREAMRRTRSSYRRKKDIDKIGSSGNRNGIQEMDASVHSIRTLVSEGSLQTGSNWGRTSHTLERGQEPATPSGAPSSPGQQNRPGGTQPNINADNGHVEIYEDSPLPTKSLTLPHFSGAYWGDLGAMKMNQFQHGDNATDGILDGCINLDPSLECARWRGGVFLLDPLEESDGPLDSPQHTSAKSVHVEVPITPPHSSSKRTTKSKSRSPKKSTPRGRTRRKSKGGTIPPASPGMPWRETTSSQQLHHAIIGDSTEEGSSPGRTPGKKWRSNLNLGKEDLLSLALDDSVNNTLGPWKELLEMPRSGDLVHTQQTCSLLSQLVVHDQTPETVISKDEILNFSAALSSLPENSFIEQFNDTLSDSMTNPNCVPQSDSSAALDKVNAENIAIETAKMEGPIEYTERIRLIRFADEQGLPIAKIRKVGDKDDPHATGQIIILFLDPIEKKFEFIQGEYSYQTGATVSDLLKQLPSFATDEEFASMEYVGLWGTHGGPHEFGLEQEVNELGLAKREVTIAAMKGAKGESLVQDASPILSNNRIMQAVKKASRSGRCLKYIQSATELEEKDSHDGDSCELSWKQCVQIVDKPVVDDHRSEDGKKEKHCIGQKETRPYHVQPEEVYGDIIPDLDHLNDAQQTISEDFHRIQEEPRVMMKYIHAGLVATLGLVYSMRVAT